MIEALPRPLLFGSAEGDWEHERGGVARQESFTSLVAAVRGRIGRLMVPTKGAKWGARLRRMPLTSGETKECVRLRYESDEARAMPLLCPGVCVWGPSFTNLDLIREVLCEALARLHHSRALQATPRSVVCATRFKYFSGGSLLETECASCGQVDSSSHLVSCVNIGPPPESP